MVAEGDFAEGVTFSADKPDVSDDRYTAAIHGLIGKEYDKEKVSVFEFSLVKYNGKVQPNGSVKITMPTLTS